MQLARVDPAAYRTELFAGSTRGHCGPPALAMPITLMTAPSVITPRSANQLRKAKQLSGTATASNKSRFISAFCATAGTHTRSIRARLGAAQFSRSRPLWFCIAMAELGVPPIVLGHIANHRTTTKAGITLVVLFSTFTSVRSGKPLSFGLLA